MLRTALVALLAFLALSAIAVAQTPSAPPPQPNAEIVWVSWATGPAILFESNGVWSIRRDGTGLRRLTGIEGGQPSWSPEGRRIALSWGDRGIAVMNADGGNLRHIRRTGHTPMWSPDARQIAYIAPRALWIVGSDGKDARQVARLRLGDAPRHEVDWSQDGTQLVFSQCLLPVPENHPCHTRPGGVGVFTVRAQPGGRAPRISRGDASCPDWGTEGRIAFSAAKGIIVSRVDGSQPRTRFARAARLCADWSPSGRLLAAQGEASLLVTRAAGGASWKVATLPRLPTCCLYPEAPSSAWSPDGRWIAVARPVERREGQVSYRLYVVNVQTGRARVLLQTRS